MDQKQSSVPQDNKISFVLGLNYQVSDCYYKREMKNILNDQAVENEPDTTDACLRQFSQALNNVIIDPQGLTQPMKLNVFSDELNPVRKLYLQKCEQNNLLKDVIKNLKKRLATRTQIDLDMKRHSDLFKNYTASFLSTTDVSAIAPSRNHDSDNGKNDKGMDFLKYHAHTEEVCSKNENMQSLHEEYQIQQSSNQYTSFIDSGCQSKRADFDHVTCTQNYKVSDQKLITLDQKLAQANEKIKSLQETCNKLSREQSNYSNAMKLIQNLRTNFEQHKTFIKFPDTTSVTKYDFQIIEHRDLSKSLAVFEDIIQKLEQETWNKKQEMSAKTVKNSQVLLLKISKSMNNLEQRIQKMKACFDQVEIYIQDDDNRFEQNTDYDLPNIEVRTIDFRPYLTKEYIELHKLNI